MVEYAEDLLMETEAEKVLLQTRAAADHLPEFYGGPHRLCEDQVEDFGDVDARVEHVNRNRDGKVAVSAAAFEIINELLGSRVVVVDDLAEAPTVLRIHLIKHLPHEYGMLMVSRKNDALASKLTGRIAQPVFHQVTK